jgi:hypothetical protein
VVLLGTRIARLQARLSYCYNDARWRVSRLYRMLVHQGAGNIPN